VVALGLSKGGFAGAGQMATPLLALAMPPLEAAAILLPIMMAQDAAALWVYRKDWSGTILAITLPGALLGVGAAWALAAHISDAAVRLLIGVTTIGFVLYYWIGPKRVAREAGQPGVTAGVLSGAMSGFTSTLCQAGGPPFQMYVLAQKLAKMNFVGTTAFFFATTNAFKVVPYFALGQFSTKGMGTSLVLLPLAMATNMLGFWGGPHHAAGAVLQDHDGADVHHLDRAGALRDNRYSARLMRRQLLPPSHFDSCTTQNWRRSLPAVALQLATA
jgi:uncharacterized membrane protein YfcA